MMRLFSMLTVVAVTLLVAGCKPPQKRSPAAGSATEKSAAQASATASDANRADDGSSSKPSPTLAPVKAVKLSPPPPRSDAALLKKYAEQSMAEILAASPPGDWQGDVALVDQQASHGSSAVAKLEDSAFFSFQPGAFLPPLLDRVAVADFNADGRLDVMAFAGDGSPMRLLVQAEQGKSVSFVRKSDPGIDVAVAGHVILPVDFDADGRTDLMILRGDGRPNSLLKNTASDGFVDVTIERGLLDFRNAQAALWADFDGDGALDLLVVNNGAKQRCALYMAQADGRFEDRSHAWGLSDMGQGVTAAALLDIDADGWLDVILIGAERSKGSVVGAYRNLAGKGFERLDLPKAMSASACLVADLDGDGREDMLCSDGDTWQWWRNVGESAPKQQAPFANVSEVAGLLDASLSGNSSACIADIDADGDLDLLDGASQRLLINRRGDHFVDADRLGSPLGLADAAVKILAVDDFDGDGGQDLLCSDGLLLGKASADATWLRLEIAPELAGSMISVSVRDAAWVESTVYRRVGVSGNERLSIGLGDAETITDLQILRPGGAIVRVDAAKLRTVIRIEATGASAIVK